MNIIRIKEYGSVLVSRLISLSEAEDSASKIGAFKIYPDVLERGLIRVQKVPSIYEGVSFDEVIIPQK